MNALSNLYHTIEAKPKTAFGITFLFLIAYQLISAFIGSSYVTPGFIWFFTITYFKIRNAWNTTLCIT